MKNNTVDRENGGVGGNKGKTEPEPTASLTVTRDMFEGRYLVCRCKKRLHMPECYDPDTAIATCHKCGRHWQTLGFLPPGMDGGSDWDGLYD